MLNSGFWRILYCRRHEIYNKNLYIYSKKVKVFQCGKTKIKGFEHDNILYLKKDSYIYNRYKSYISHIIKYNY